MADIFISYSQVDRERVRPIAAALEDLGWSVWWDTKGAAGEILEEMVQQELDSAKSVIVVWSKTSVKSDWVIGEADEARKKRKLVPIAIDDVAPPIRFRQFNTVLINPFKTLADSDNFKRVVSGVETITVITPSDVEQTQTPEHIQSMQIDSQGDGDTDATNTQLHWENRLSDIRRRLFLGGSISDLRRLRHEIDEVLESEKSYDAEVLKEDIETALRFEERKQVSRRVVLEAREPLYAKSAPQWTTIWLAAFVGIALALIIWWWFNGQEDDSIGMEHKEPLKVESSDPLNVKSGDQLEVETSPPLKVETSPPLDIKSGPVKVDGGSTTLPHDSGFEVLNTAFLDKLANKYTLRCKSEITPSTARYQFVYVWSTYEGNEKNEARCADRNQITSEFVIQGHKLEKIEIHYSGSGNDRAVVTWELWAE